MDNYDILTIIGEGAYGVVLKCRNIQTNQIVAIKKFKQTEQDEIVKKTTMRQVKVLKMLRNINVVQMKQAFRKKRIVYLVFQYVHNNLLEVLEKSPKGLEPSLIRSFMYQLLKGLDYLHFMNIIHRDIKPENLLVSQKKVLKICDFGFARILKKQHQRQELTDYVATRWYRPPELLVGAKYDKSIDLWAVGCIFGQLIDGMPMFPGQNQVDQLYLIQKCLGTLIPEHKEIFQKNTRFHGMKFPEILYLDSIQKRYQGKMDSKSLHFIKSLLKMNPFQRLTARQALKHPYFDGIREESVNKLGATQQNKIQNRITSAISTEQQLLTNSIRRKKTNINAYNPPFRQRKDVEFHDTIYIKNKKSQPRKEDQSLQSIKFYHFRTNKEMSKLYSKSMNKKTIQKYKQKELSNQNHHNKEILVKTQDSFYIQSMQNIIQQKKKQQGEQTINNYNRNKIYGSKKASKVNHIQNILKKNNKGIMSTQSVRDQEDLQNIYQSTGQLPFIMMGKKAEKKKDLLKQKGSTNIITYQNTYYYKAT